MAARRSRGTVTEKGKGKYLLRVFTGYDGSGTRQYVSETFEGTLTGAKDRLADMVAQKSKGGLVAKPKGTVNEFLDTWLSQLEVRARTKHDYTRVLQDYVRPHLGTARLSRLSPPDVRRMLNRLKPCPANCTCGGKLHDGYAPRTVRMALEVLRNALETAVADKMIRENPARARLVKKALPAKVRHEPTTISGDDVGTFLDVLKGERLEAFFVLQLFGGLRPSEALALRWSDVNGSTISVTRVFVTKTGTPHWEAPKSKTSRRAVVVPDVVVVALKDHRKRQLEERLAAGPKWQDPTSPAYVEGAGELVFCDAQGHPIPQDDLRTPWKNIKAAAGLDPKVTIYALRHSCATLLLERGVALKVVSERLGHSTIALTADVYSHVSQSMQKQAADVLGELAK